MQFDNDPRHALLAEWDQDPPANHWLNAGGNGIGKRHVKGHGQSNVAVKGHLESILRDRPTMDLFCETGTCQIELLARACTFSIESHGRKAQLVRYERAF